MVDYKSPENKFTFIEGNLKISLKKLKPEKWETLLI